LGVISGFSVSAPLSKTLGRSGFVNGSSWVKADTGADSSDGISISVWGIANSSVSKISWFSISASLSKSLGRSGLVNGSSWVEADSGADSTKRVSIAVSISKTKISWFSTALATASIASGVTVGGDYGRPVVLGVISGFSVSAPLSKTLGRSGLINGSSWVETDSGADTSKRISISVWSVSVSKISWFGISTSLSEALS